MQYLDSPVGLVFLCFRKLPEDGIPMTKHAGV